MMPTPPPTQPADKENAPVGEAPVKRKRAKRTKLQKTTAIDNTAAMNAAIDAKREEYRASIKDLAFEYNRSASVDLQP